MPDFRDRGLLMARALLAQSTRKAWQTPETLIKLRHEARITKSMQALADTMGWSFHQTRSRCTKYCIKLGRKIRPAYKEPSPFAIPIRLNNLKTVVCSEKAKQNMRDGKRQLRVAQSG